MGTIFGCAEDSGEKTGSEDSDMLLAGGVAPGLYGWYAEGDDSSGLAAALDELLLGCCEIGDSSDRMDSGELVLGMARVSGDSRGPAEDANDEVES